MLCQEHLEKNNTDFIVETSIKWKYIAIPIARGSCSCHICTNSLSEPSVFMREVDFRGKNLRYANFIAKKNKIRKNIKKN